MVHKSFLSRRAFLKRSSLGLLSVCLCPGTALVNTQSARADSLAPAKKILVVVQLNGGNDGLNTVIPFNDGAYYDARPKLGLESEKIIPLNNAFGLNCAMTGVAHLYKQGKVALLQSVGYPNQSRSHFRSLEVLQSGVADSIGESGWLGRYLEFDQSSDAEFQAVSFDCHVPKTLASPSIRVTTMTEGRQAICRSDSCQSIVAYPHGPFGDSLKSVAQMIAAGINTRIYTLSLGGFDTHANQREHHDMLLKQLSDGLVAFEQDLERENKSRQVLTLVYSEFGRRLVENAEGGSDHGSSQPFFVVGSSVKGGIWGDHASLRRLNEGDLDYNLDFRDIYATLIDRWLGGDGSRVLSRRFETIPFV